MRMNVDFIKFIDWEKAKTYEDFAILFRAYAASFSDSGITSRTGDLVDSDAKWRFLKALYILSDLCDDVENWIYVEPTVKEKCPGSPHSGHASSDWSCPLE